MPPTVSAAVFLHLGLEQVPAASTKLVAGGTLVAFEGLVVPLVVVFDDLESPPTFDDVAPDEISGDAVGDSAMARFAQEVHGFSECEVGRASQAVEPVQKTPCMLDGLERLTELAQRFDRGVVDALRSLMPLVGPVVHTSTVGALLGIGTSEMRDVWMTTITTHRRL